MSVLLPTGIVILAGLHAAAQRANDGFDPDVRGDASANVSAIAVQDDGKILIGGHFASVRGVTRSNLARLNVDGSVDASFDPGLGGPVLTDLVTVRALLVQPDGKILVGGEFSLVAGQERHSLVRLHPDGQVDQSFGASADGVVEAMALQADGKLVVGGWFDHLNGQARFGMGRFNADGSLDLTFDASANNVVSSVAVLPDGKILLSGAFDRVNGIRRWSLARLLAGGQLDPTFPTELGDSANVMLVQPDGKILLGGDFEEVGTVARPHLARLNRDGSLDPTFTPSPNHDVKAMAVQPDGKIVVGGKFTAVNGKPRQHLARILPDGSLDETFVPQPNDHVGGLAVQSDGGILVGGLFTTLGGTNRNCLGRLYPDGSLDVALHVATTREVNGLAVQADGKILAQVGGLGSFSGTIGRFHPDGRRDVQFNAGADGGVNSLLVQPDGHLVVGGEFECLYEGYSASLCSGALGRFLPSGRRDPMFNPPRGQDGEETIAMLQADGQILAGGQWPGWGGPPWTNRQHLARFAPDGTLDPDFNPGADHQVMTFAVQEDGRILVGGEFTMLGGKARSRLGRLHPDGTVDDSFAPGVGGAVPYNFPQVNCVAIQPDGRILVGGYFTMLAGQRRNYLGRLFPDGSLDLTFDPDISGDGPEHYRAVNSLVVRTDGKILVGGVFTAIGGQACTNVARLNADGTVDADFNPGAHALVSTGALVQALAIQTDGKILMAGRAVPAFGQPPPLARLAADTAALQSLQVNPTGTAVTWLRSGSGPEIEQVFLQISSDGAEYTRLGRPVRVAGGWELAGLSLPLGQHFYLRACGRAMSGFHNVSSGLIESVRQFYLPPRITCIAKQQDGTFTVTGRSAAAQSCVLLTTTGLTPPAAWTPIATNTTDASGLVLFPDLAATNGPQRFYQLLWP